MAHFLQTLLYVQASLAFLVQFVIIALQYAAYRRHQTNSFLWLVLSTGCGIIFISLSIAPLVFRLTLLQMVWIYSINFVLFCKQAVFGLLGIVALFRDYDRLASLASASGSNSLD